VGETIEQKFTFTPPFAGRATLMAKFTSKELDDVDGFLAFEVEPDPDNIIFNEVNHGIIRRTDVIP
jgi:transglutaminase 1